MKQIGWICDKCKDAIRKGRGHVCICKYTGQLPDFWFKPLFTPCKDCEWKPYEVEDLPTKQSVEEWLISQFRQHFPELADIYSVEVTSTPALSVFLEDLLITDTKTIRKNKSEVHEGGDLFDVFYPPKKHCLNCRYHRRKNSFTKMSARCSRCIMETPYSKSAPGRYPLWAKQTEAQREKYGPRVI